MTCKEKTNELIDFFSEKSDALKAVNLILKELNDCFEGFASADRILFWEKVAKEIVFAMSEDYDFPDTKK